MVNSSECVVNVKGEECRLEGVHPCGFSAVQGACVCKPMAIHQHCVLLPKQASNKWSAATRENE
ncbi:hypothetical protein M5D96_013399, partial [Drosophila gunungcola]